MFLLSRGDDISTSLNRNRFVEGRVRVWSSKDTSDLILHTSVSRFSYPFQPTKPDTEAPADSWWWTCTFCADKAGTRYRRRSFTSGAEALIYIRNFFHNATESAAPSGLPRDWEAYVERKIPWNSHLYHKTKILKNINEHLVAFAYDRLLFARMGHSILQTTGKLGHLSPPRKTGRPPPQI